MKYFMTDNQVIHEEEKLQDGVWVRMISPTQEECEEIADVLNVDIDDIKAALDEEESSRIELQDGYTLILVDVPTTEIRHDKQSYTTIPLGIILTQDVIVTVCTEDTPVLKNFVINRVKEFSTKKRLRFVYQILYRTATIYQTNLRIIDKRRTEIEERIGQHTEDVDLIDLHDNWFTCTDMIEKPSKDKIMSLYSILGRCVLPPQIFDILAHTAPGAGGEIQLTDAMCELARTESMIAVDFTGKRYDMGNKLGVMQAQVEVALKHPEIGESFRAYLKELAKTL